MVWWHRTRRLSHVERSHPLRDKGARFLTLGDNGAATFAGAAARSLFAKNSCAVVVSLAVSHGMPREDTTTVALPPDLEAKILRYYHAEKWRVGTIARQLHLHHSAVSRVIAQAGLPTVGTKPRPSQVDQFLPFIRQTLEKFPSLTASRLYDMVRGRGYTGNPDHFRHLVARYRPKRQVEAFLRLRTLPAEQAQVDWAHFGHITIGQAKRPLMAFVMVLSYSRSIFLHFFLDARMESFLAGHVAAFKAWNGVPRILLYDNLKSAVLERQGDAIHFNPELLKFAGHYRYDPRPVAVARGNEKGRVERAIQYVRSSFFAARDINNIDTLNAQAAAWCLGHAAERRCPDQQSLSVREVLAQELPRLLPLPDNPYPVATQVPVKVAKTPYVRFDLNDYSVPHTHVQRRLTLLADPHQIRIVDGTQVLATHRRSYDKGQQIEEPKHISALVEEKHAARRLRATDRLVSAVPASQDLLIQAAERGSNLGAITGALMRLLSRYGAAELQAAIVEALTSNVPHPNTVRLVLERRREAREQPPPVDLALPDHVLKRDAPVQPHRLESYDKLTEQSDE